MTPNPQYPGQPAGGPKQTSGLAIAALILGILAVVPLVGCLAGPVAIGLGIAALVQIGKRPELGGRGLAIAGIAVPLSLGLISTMAAAAIPNFIKFQARAKQSECKSNLKSAYTAAMSYRQETGKFSSQIFEIGFIPERGNRYAYFLDVEGPMEDRLMAGPLSLDKSATGVDVDLFKYGSTMRSLKFRDVPRPLAGEVEPGIKGRCPECTFVAVCAGNIDNDDTLDVWSVSTDGRTDPRGQPILPGMPFNEVNDVNE